MGVRFHDQIDIIYESVRTILDCGVAFTVTKAFYRLSVKEKSQALTIAVLVKSEDMDMFASVLKDRAILFDRIFSKDTTDAEIWLNFISE